MILRPLFLFATVVAVLMALATTAGRVFVTLLPRFEPQINALLLPFAVELSGLDGEWRNLNPVIYVDSARFGGGRAHGFRIEVDLLASALSNALVAERLHVDRLSLDFVRGFDGTWRLGERPAGDGAFDLRAFVLESGVIALPDVDVTFYVERNQGSSVTEQVGQFTMDATFVNSASRHQADVRLVGDESGDLRIRYDVDEKWFGILPEGRARVESEAFSMPPQLGVALGGVGLDLASVAVDWEIVEGRGAGRLTLTAAGLTLPTGRLERLDAEVVGTAEFGHETWSLRGERLEVAAGDTAWDLSGTQASIDDGVWTFSLPSVDISNAATLARSALRKVDAAYRWLGKVKPQGRFRDVAVRWSADGGLAYAASLTEGGIDAYRGAPRVRHASATVRGSQHSVRADISGGAALHFEGLLDEPSVIDDASGSLIFGWQGRRFGIRGNDLVARLGETRAAGGFLLSRPPDDRSEDRLVIVAEVWNMAASVAKTYIPSKLPENLYEWLQESIISGHVEHARIAYHGHFKVLPDVPMRQIELALSVRDGVIRFDPEWPPAENLSGEVFVTTEATIGRMNAGRILDVAMEEGSVYVPNDAEYVAIAGVGHTRGEAVLRLVRDTPLSQWLTFVDPTWTAEGDLSFRTDFRVPVAGPDDLLDVDLDVALESVTVNLADVELKLGQLLGSAKYRYPFDISASNVHGVLFDRPARFGADTLGQEVALLVSGRTTVAGVLDWLNLPNPGLADGEANFDATYRFWPEIDRPPSVDVVSDLVGVAVSLPSPFGKPADEPRQARADTVLGNLAVRLRAEVDGMGALQLELADGAIKEGTVGIGTAAPPPLSNTLVISGRVAQADLAGYMDVLPAADEATVGDINWLVDNLRIDRAFYSDVPFTNVVISGEKRDDAPAVVNVESDELVASMTVPAAGVPRVDVQRLHLPAGDGDDEGDPLADLDVSRVPDFDLNIDRVLLGDDSYGNWTFKLRNRRKELALEDLVADVKGLHIVAHEPVLWSGGEGVTVFHGVVSAGDLAQVLPLWDYAASVESKSATMDAQVTWLGSPLNFWVRDIVGQLDLEVREGRFLDVETGSGPMRVVSLMNFNAIAKRMTLDFSDVFGKGIAFDKIDGMMAVDRGVITFLEPIVIDGTGSNFKVTGSVDLVNGDLDNEMIVTLPVNKSLPWYAAYLGVVASPLAAGAVLVGERIFRDQIEQFSSARYKVAGTLDEPTVTFVGVFNPKPPGEGKTSEKNGAQADKSEAKDA